MTITRDWKWEKNYLSSPVTSVEFVGSDLVLSGNGPFLNVHSATRGVLLEDKCLLPGSRIHGIRVEQKYGKLVVIFGQKVIRVVRLQENASQSSTSVEAATDIVSFPDLIWDAHWLYDEDDIPTNIAIATAHNAVWCWDWENNVKQLIAQCEDPCILYSAQFFGSHLNDLLLASGTVFNQILIWKVQGKKDEHSKTSILQRLAGHEGVIFSINFNKTGTLLSSVSDDRSIRLWNVTNLKTFESNGCVEPLLVVYGHTARVWDARLLETCFVSIGEDLVCNVWSYDGSIVKMFKGHTGRNIWSLAINQSEDLIATGGGDGSIRLWPLASPEHCGRTAAREAFLPSSAHNKTDPQKTKEDYPRFVSLLDQCNLLVMTNEGCLYKYSWLKKENFSRKQGALSKCTAADSLNVEDQWELLLKDTDYSSYSVLALSPCREIIAFGNLKGNIKLQDTDFKQPSLELDAYSGKVHNLLWSSQNSPHHLFSCGPEGQITWWSIKYNNTETIFDVTPLCSFILPPSKQRWASAIEIFPKSSTRQNSDEESWTTESVFVVCGDRKGSLHLFDPKNFNISSDKPISPSHSLPLIHGKAGISHLCLHNNNIYSSGRDGVYRQVRVHKNTLEVIDTKKVFKGLDWVERLIFTSNGDLLIAGFHAAYFVLWSVQRNELLWRVKCGGAHRVWDLAIQQLDVSISGAVLSFIKDSMIYTHKITFPSEMEKAVLKPSCHGREATCLCYIDSLVGQEGEICYVFATGSEDTNIKLMISNCCTRVSSPIFTAHGHISSVRALSVTKRPPSQIQPSARDDKTSGHLLFSGGGRASLKCWRVDLSLIDVDSDGCHGDAMTSSPMVFLGEYSFSFSNQRRRRKKQNLQSLSEIRFMSLTSLSAAEIIVHSSNQDFMDSCQSLYFVMAACSDGFVRVFAFDEQKNKLSLLAQSQYLKRCVLTVNHVIDFHAGDRPLVILFAGDTAGRISCWDVTFLLLSHIRQCCKSSIEYGAENLPVDADNIANKPSGDEAFETNVPLKSRNTSQTTLESVNIDHSEESGTTDKLKAVVDEQNSNTENISSDSCNNGRLTEDHVTNLEKHENMVNVKKFVDDQPLAGKECVSHFAPENASKENTSVCYDTPDQSSLTEIRDNQTLNTTFQDQSDFSCLPLVRTFLAPPSHVFDANQSGVNAISLVKMKEQYLVVSGGDDSALYAAQFNLKLDDNDVTKVHLIQEVSEPSAHTSSVTGVKALKNGLVISSAVDQRLVVWELVSSQSFAFCRLAVEIVDVADVQDLEVWGERDGCLMAGVCGVGLQTFSLVGHT